MKVGERTGLSNHCRECPFPGNDFGETFLACKPEHLARPASSQVCIDQQNVLSGLCRNQRQAGCNGRLSLVWMSRSHDEHLEPALQDERPVKGSDGLSVE